MTQTETPMRLRLALALIGALAGYFFWLLFDYLPDVLDSKRLLMLLAAFAAGFFGGLLLMAGRLGLRVATAYAAGIAVLTALLLFWASFRFVDVEAYFDSVHPFIAMFVLAHLPLPFVMAHVTATGGWRDYEALFDNAWSIFVRAITAWLFTGLFWLVIFLSDQLLSLVGFEYLGELVEEMWFALPLTGLILGLALAVLHEMDAVVSTLRRLALQLARLLLPPVAVVVVLFILLVPFQGLDQVFGILSAAGTMLAMAVAAVTLITSAVDARDSDAATSKIMVLSAKVLAGLLPIIVGIAVYAIWLRVMQYGWTPARIAAVLISLVVLVYAIAYASSLFAGPAWRARIRTANTWNAAAMVCLSFLWLTPVLNVERISANSHIARFLAGKIEVSAFDVWRLGRQWGKAGQAALEQARGLSDHAEQDKLTAKIQRFDDNPNRWAFAAEIREVAAQENLDRLRKIMPIRPVGTVLPEIALEGLPRSISTKIVAGCEKKLVDDLPGCVAVIGSFSRRTNEQSVVIFWSGQKNKSTEIVVLEQTDNDGGRYHYHRSIVSLGGLVENLQAGELIGQIYRGEFRFAPIRLDALEIRDLQIYPRQ